MTTVDETLGSFSEDAITAKLLRSIYRVVPYSPELAHYGTVDDAVRALDPGASATTLDRARGIAGDDERIANVLWMSNLLDMGDKGYAIATGLWSAVKLFRGQGMQALETDTQQRNDAVLKAIGLGYMVHNAFPGPVGDKVSGFRKASTGQALAVYYGAVEVALPFADNAALEGGKLVGQLYNRYGAAQWDRLSGMASGHSLDGVRETLDGVLEPVSKVVDLARGYIKPVADATRPYIPGAGTAADGTDKVAGMVANAADLLPVYRLLGARLAAESAARQAIGG